MSRFGFTLWSPNSEVFVMGIVGMIVSAAEAPLYTIRPDMREVWNLELPQEKFSVGLQYLLRLILINVIIVRCVTVHCYIVSFLFITWPIFLEEQPWMLLPWLVVGGVKNIVLELVVLLTGSFMFMRYASPFNLFCMEFLLIKGVTLALSIYMWMSVLFLYCDLVNPPRMFSRHETSANKSLELAIRRRMCKSLCTEVVWRRRMLSGLESAGVVHVTVSLEEDLLTPERKVVRTNAQSRSLDSILDKMGYDWDLLDDLSTRRALEGKGPKVPLTLKARKFLQLTKNDIAQARQHKYSAKETEDKSTQTNTLSKKFLDAYSKRSVVSSTSGLKGVDSRPMITRLGPKFSPVELRPEMSERRRPELRAQQQLRDLPITMPPRFGYRHAATQASNLSRKYLLETERVHQSYDADSLVIEEAVKSSQLPGPSEEPVLVVSLCSGSDDNSSANLNPTEDADDDASVEMSTASTLSATSREANPGGGQTPEKRSHHKVYASIVTETRSPFRMDEDYRMRSDSASHCGRSHGARVEKETTRETGRGGQGTSTAKQSLAKLSKNIVNDLSMKNKKPAPDSSTPAVKPTKKQTPSVKVDRSTQATDNARAVAGTSRGIQVDRAMSVFTMSLLESDYSFGTSNVEQSDVRQQQVTLPAPILKQEATTATVIPPRQFQMESRPSIRSIKRYAKGGGAGSKMPPLAAQAQKPQRSGIVLPRKPPRGSQKVSLQIDVSDPEPAPAQITLDASSERLTLIHRALALNEERLQRAAMEHGRNTPSPALGMLVDDQDFRLEIPQPFPVRRDSSGSLNRFLAQRKREDSNK